MNGRLGRPRGRPGRMRKTSPMAAMQRKKPLGAECTKTIWLSGEDTLSLWLWWRQLRFWRYRFAYLPCGGLKWRNVHTKFHLKKSMGPRTVRKHANIVASTTHFNVTVPVASPNGESVKLQYRALIRPPATSMKRYSKQTTTSNMNTLHCNTFRLKTWNVLQNDNIVLWGI
jgi:hypothetical protein